MATSERRRRVWRFTMLGFIMLAVVAMHHLSGPNRAEHSHAATTATVTVMSVIVVSVTVVSVTGPDSHAVAHPTHATSAAAPGDHGQHPVPEDPASGPTEHSPAHHILNMCLAVLMAAALVGGLWLLITRAWRLTLPRRGGLVPRAVHARPPRRRHGFALLMSLCVIRV